MRRDVLALVAAGAALAPLTAFADDYWHVYRGGGVDSFVDASTIETASDGSRFAWITHVMEGGGAKSKFHSQKLMEQFACGDRQMTVAEELDTDAKSKKSKDLNDELNPYVNVVPDTPGAAEYAFVCRPDPPPLNDPKLFHLGDGDPTAWADKAYVASLPVKPKTGGPPSPFGAHHHHGEPPSDASE